MDSKSESIAKEKTQIIVELRQKYKLNILLSIAQLSRSTFYYQLSKQRAIDPLLNLKDRIKSIYHKHKGRYGYRRITATLRQEGELVNHKKVQRIMQQLGLKSMVRIKKYRSYKGQEGRIAPHLLQRQFAADHPNQKWVTDVTEFAVAGEKLYLSPMMDLYNGEIIAHELCVRPVLRMVTDMLESAKKRLKKNEKPWVHSDQGWHYQHIDYQKRLTNRGLEQSMSRKGNCLDNAPMESFFGTLKSELYYLQKWESINQLRMAINDYIYYYNHERIKLKLKGLSPVQYRTQSFSA